MNTARKLTPSIDSLITGRFSKEQAAGRIVEGNRHLISIAGEDASALTELTQKGLVRGRVPRFPWELLFFRRSIHLHNSQSRSALIGKVVRDLKIENRREIRERVEAVLEELITNAIYHATRSPEGISKYIRTDKVFLEYKERITVTYAQRPSGIFICVTDHGGRLSFGNLQNAFSRCYGRKDSSQIENKESGAGLGLYLVFEAAMHLKIRVKSERETRISCWISRKNDNEQQGFSFNFYSEENG